MNKDLLTRDHAQRGGMLVELMMSVALAALVIPFIFRYQQTAVRRAENVALARQIETIQGALERYIIDNQAALLAPVGKNITRVKMADLGPYGVSDNILAQYGDKYQLRVLKTADRGADATLQGVIVYDAPNISPARTREIINLGGDSMGFIDDARAFGAFGTWRVDAVDLGVGSLNGIIETTMPTRGMPRYLWRVPSDTSDDATMMSGLNLGGHNISDARFFDASVGRFDAYLRAGVISANNVMFQNRTTLDRHYQTRTATVSGTLSSDSRSMDVTGTLTLNDMGKFSSFVTEDLWVTNLTLGGISIATDADPAVLKINQNLDMTGGRINALYASVAFTGSITPRLVVKTRIEDSINPSYYWDVASRTAFLSDLTLAELTQRMGPLVAVREKRGGPDATSIFGAVATNKNATVSDYMNAINEIAQRVRIKYRRLNLQ